MILNENFTDFITGVTFNEAYDSSHVYEEEDFKVRCIHINELIQNKKASGRPKDLADAHILENILKKRMNKNK